jgi:hypothetical protein
MIFMVCFVLSGVVGVVGVVRDVRVLDVSDKSAPDLRRSAGRAPGEALDQRFAMYIVISNPKRRSVNSGLLQVISISSLVF